MFALEQGFGGRADENQAAQPLANTMLPCRPKIAKSLDVIGDRPLQPVQPVSNEQTSILAAMPIHSKGVQRSMQESEDAEQGPLQREVSRQFAWRSNDKRRYSVMQGQAPALKEFSKNARRHDLAIAMPTQLPEHAAKHLEPRGSASNRSA